MSKHVALTTQGAHPWRAVIRTAFALIVAMSAMAPLIYQAVAQAEPGAATGAAAGLLAIAGAITRVLALPVVDEFLTRFLPWLSAAGREDGERPADPAEPIPGTTLDLGATEYLPHSE